MKFIHLIMRLRNNWPTVITSVIAICYFIPYMFYLGDMLGLRVVNTEKVIGVSFEFKAKWYPIASSNTLLGKLLISSSAPTVIYCEMNWINPWGCDQVWVSKSDVWRIKDENSVFVSVHQFQWGTVGIVKDDVTRTPNGKLAIIKGFDIGISGENLNILESIKSISR